MRSLATLVAFTSIVGSAAYAETPIERGSYLVNTIMTCGNCHSPKGPPAAVAGKDFSGGLRFNVPGAFDVTAPNITSDKESGIGTWSADDIKKLLLTGVAKDGKPIAVMPTGFYNILLPSDLDAIVAYTQSIKPVSNQVPAPIYLVPIKQRIFPGAEKPIDPAALSDKVQRGFYLATIGHCMECHTPREKGQLDLSKIGRLAAVSNSPDRAGIPRCFRAISPQARLAASELGPTPRSGAPSHRASTRTARNSIHRWALAITPT